MRRLSTHDLTSSAVLACLPYSPVHFFYTLPSVFFNILISSMPDLFDKLKSSPQNRELYAH